jgi:hypothetical protein
LPKSPILPKIAKIEKPESLQYRGNEQPDENSGFHQSYYQILFTRIACSASLSAMFGDFGTAGNCLIRATHLNLPFAFLRVLCG